MRKHMKLVMKQGVSKEMAKEIVETAYETGKGINMEMYINYAMNLTYGMNFVKQNIK